MSASWPGNMRGPRVKTPLLLLLLLLTALTRTVFCQEEDDYADPPDETLDEAPDPETGDDSATTVPAPDPSSPTDPAPTEDTSSDTVNEGVVELGSGGGGQTGRSFSIYGEDPPSISASTEYPDLSGSTPAPDEVLSLLIILIPVVLVVVIIAMIVCGIFLKRRWNKKVRNQELGKEDPYLDGSSTEKVPMPMFEEDVPSVLELEMDELDQWMKKDSETAEDAKLA